jgi:5-methylcytosine-specific restriction protein A
MAWERSTRRDRLPPDWDSRVRPAVFARDGHICYVCGKPGANDVDHKNPGDDHSLENLGPIHKWPCHARKSAAEGGRAAALKRPKINREPEAHPGLRKK